MNCDMCGKETELFRAIVEGSQLTVCGACSKYGKITGRVAQPATKKKKVQKPAPKANEAIEAVVKNFGAILKAKRESLGMTQAEFAKKIAERESALHKMETGEIVPTIDRARQLQRILEAKLIEEIKEEPVETAKDRTVMTLGDFIKIKARKKNI